ncbi:amidohydrolase family protein, partial [Microbacterium sp. NPDC055683]
MSLTLRNALSVWSEDEEGPGDVHVVGGAIASAPADGAEELDVTGCIVTPGLVNAHHHLLQTAFRTLPGTRGVAMRDWLPTMAAAYRDAGVDGALAYAAARAGMAEALLSGVTTVADHHLTWPDADDGVAIAQGAATAARELGGRIAFVRGTAGDRPDAAARSASAIAEA